MVTGARPRIVFCPPDESRPNGIVLDVANLLKNAPVVQHAREEPPLPEVAGNALLAVEVLGISHVEGIEGVGKPSLSLRDTNIVDMVPHQAVGPNLNEIAVGAFPQPGEVALKIAVLFKYRLPVVPALSDLVRVSYDGGAGETRHWDKLPPMGA